MADDRQGGPRPGQRRTWRMRPGEGPPRVRVGIFSSGALQDHVETPAHFFEICRVSAWQLYGRGSAKTDLGERLMYFGPIDLPFPERDEFSSTLPGLRILLEMKILEMKLD